MGLLCVMKSLLEKSIRTSDANSQLVWLTHCLIVSSLLNFKILASRTARTTQNCTFCVCVVVCIVWSILKCLPCLFCIFYMFSCKTILHFLFVSVWSMYSAYFISSVLSLQEKEYTLGTNSLLTCSMVAALIIYPGCIVPPNTFYTFTAI